MCQPGRGPMPGIHNPNTLNTSPSSYFFLPVGLLKNFRPFPFRNFPESWWLPIGGGDQKPSKHYPPCDHLQWGSWWRRPPMRNGSASAASSGTRIASGAFLPRHPQRVVSSGVWSHRALGHWALFQHHTQAINKFKVIVHDRIWKGLTPI